MWNCSGPVRQNIFGKGEKGQCRAPGGTGARAGAGGDAQRKKGRSIHTATLACGLVPRAGLEPAQLLPLPPQDSVSTSSTTSAAEKYIDERATLGKSFFRAFPVSAMPFVLREPRLTGARFSGLSSGSSAAARCLRPCRRETPGRGIAFHPLRRRVGRKSSVRPGS